MSVGKIRFTAGRQLILRARQHVTPVRDSSGFSRASTWPNPGRHSDISRHRWPYVRDRPASRMTAHSCYSMSSMPDWWAAIFAAPSHRSARLIGGAPVDPPPACGRSRPWWPKAIRRAGRRRRRSRNAERQARLESSYPLKLLWPAVLLGLFESVERAALNSRRAPRSSAPSSL